MSKFFKTPITRSSKSHLDQNLRDIIGRYPVLFEKSEHQFVICGDPKISIEVTILLINPFSHKKCGVGRHPAGFKFTMAILRRFPVSNDLSRIILIYILEIPITAINILPLKDINHRFQNFIMGIKVISM